MVRKERNEGGNKREKMVKRERYDESYLLLGLFQLYFPHAIR